MTSPDIDVTCMPAGTKAIFDRLADCQFISKYTLVGGTALSVQLKHRLSEDLDFISDSEKLDISAIKRKISALFGGYRIIRQDAPWQVDFVIENVKVTFFSAGAITLPFALKKYSFRYRSMNICEAKTVASLKMAAIAQRNTIRDYYDLYIICKYHYSLNEIIDQTKMLIPGLSPITYTETLIYTDDVEEFSMKSHLMPKEVVSKVQIAEFFIEELRKIRDFIS